MSIVKIFENFGNYRGATLSYGSVATTTMLCSIEGAGTYDGNKKTESR